MSDAREPRPPFPTRRELRRAQAEGRELPTYPTTGQTPVQPEPEGTAPVRRPAMPVRRTAAGLGGTPAETPPQTQAPAAQQSASQQPATQAPAAQQPESQRPESRAPMTRAEARRRSGQATSTQPVSTDASTWRRASFQPVTGAEAPEPGPVQEPQSDPRPVAAPEDPEFPEAVNPSTGLRSRRLDHERQKAKSRRRTRKARGYAIVLLVLALVAAAAYFAITALTGDGGPLEATDYPGPGTGEATIVVEQGDLGSDIGAKLVDAGVVKTEEAFFTAFNANKAAAGIKPGTYTMMQQLPAADAVAALLDEANRVDNAVTVIPGATASEVAENISKVMEVDVADVEKAFKDSAAIGLPAEAGGNVEGWLKPGSYEMGKGQTPTELISKMVAGTVKELDDLGVDPKDRQTLLIKASILEREVNIDEYLPQVARVIENRLTEPEAETRGMLQMDSTVLYGVGKSGGIPTRDDLQNDNPYNTYLHAGLPPTPIAQPDTAAIEATLKPADGTWLYFVTVDLDTGETLFATTLDEQKANTLKLDEYCEAHKDRC